MSTIREPAPAKINLTLEIAGRRADGFHELASLIVFADVGDTITLDLDRPPGVTVSGPFADGLAGINILDRALKLVAERAPRLRLGHVHLVKSLPVAAGVGGGSADAGALLRALRYANGEAASDVDWLEIARTLGADVPGCFEAHASWMTGTGERLSKIAGGVPVLDAVLVNPMAAVPQDKTAQVFRALAAEPVSERYQQPQPPVFENRDALIAYLRAKGNDLAQPAREVVPETADVFDALTAEKDALHVALSGAGPTAFGVFADVAAAEAARARIAALHPEWWVQIARLG